MSLFKWNNFRLKELNFNDIEKEILKTPFLTRLKRIKQLGTLDWIEEYTFAKHSRFHHTEGVLALSIKFIDYLKNVSNEDFALDINWDEFAILARLAALYHDTGHGPFSHLSEKILKSLYDDTSKFRHENNSATIAKFDCNNNKHLKKLIEDTGFTNLPEQIEKVLIGKELDNETLQLAKQLISNDIDIDRLDYLYRDYQQMKRGFVSDPDFFASCLSINKFTNNLINQISELELIKKPPNKYEITIQQDNIIDAIMILLLRLNERRIFLSNKTYILANKIILKATKELVDNPPDTSLLSRYSNDEDRYMNLAKRFFPEPDYKDVVWDDNSFYVELLGLEENKKRITEIQCKNNYRNILELKWNHIPLNLRNVLEEISLERKSSIYNLNKISLLIEDEIKSMITKYLSSITLNNFDVMVDIPVVQSFEEIYMKVITKHSFIGKETTLLQTLSESSHLLESFNDVYMDNWGLNIFIHNNKYTQLPKEVKSEKLIKEIQEYIFGSVV